MLPRTCVLTPSDCSWLSTESVAFLEDTMSVARLFWWWGSGRGGWSLWGSLQQWLLNPVISVTCNAILGKHVSFLSLSFPEIGFNLLKAPLAQIFCDTHHYHYIQQFIFWHLYFHLQTGSRNNQICKRSSLPLSPQSAPEIGVGLLSGTLYLIIIILIIVTETIIIAAGSSTLSLPSNLSLETQPCVEATFGRVHISVEILEHESEIQCIHYAPGTIQIS